MRSSVYIRICTNVCKELYERTLCAKQQESYMSTYMSMSLDDMTLPADDLTATRLVGTSSLILHSKAITGTGPLGFTNTEYVKIDL